jgi:hypothetical protein
LKIYMVFKNSDILRACSQPLILLENLSRLPNPKMVRGSQTTVV